MLADPRDKRTGSSTVSLNEPEPRWPSFIAVLAVGGLYAGLPDALVLGPYWVLPSVVSALLIPTMISHHTGRHG